MESRDKAVTRPKPPSQSLIHSLPKKFIAPQTSRARLPKPRMFEVLDEDKDIALRCPRRRAQRQATETQWQVRPLHCAATRRGRRSAPSLPPIFNDRPHPGYLL